MGSYQVTIHKPGIMILRATGELDQASLEKWRQELQAFIKENADRGACGVLVDVCELDKLSTDAIDTLMEMLSEPEDFIDSIRMRFALIGIRPFTKRFLNEAMPLAPIKHIRARFFHETAEEEALAWLQAMVDSAKDLPEADKESQEKEKAPPPDAAKEADKPAKTPAKSLLGLGKQTDKADKQDKPSEKKA